MKILFISPASYTGGGQRWLHMLATGLEQRGHEVHIVFSQHGHPGTLFHNLLSKYVVHHLCYRGPQSEWPRLMVDYINTAAIEVLVVEHSERIDEIVPYCKKRPRVVFVDHTMCNETVQELKSVDSWVDEVACVSSKIAQKITWRPARVIHNACPPVPSLGTDIRQMMGIPEDAFVVGYIGRIDRNKSVDHLLGAAQQRGWWLLIAGRGPLMGQLLRTDYDKLRIFPTDVYFVGDWYRAVDVFVLPSAQEGFPLTPLEALTCGCRVAMTPVSDFPELFGDTIAFFPHRSEQIITAVENAPPPEAARAIIQKELTIDRMLDEYLEVLEE